MAVIKQDSSLKEQKAWWGAKEGGMSHDAAALVEIAVKHKLNIKEVLGIYQTALNELLKIADGVK